MATLEQKARNLLDRLEHPRAQDLSAGDVVELANLIAEHGEMLAALKAVDDYWKAGNFTRRESLWGSVRAAIARAERRQ